MRSPRYSHVVILTFLIFVVAYPVGASDTNAKNVNLTLERSAHFTMADGSDVVIEPGTYQVEAADPWLRLIPGERQECLIIGGYQNVHHEEEMSTSQSSDFLVEGDDNAVVQLLLPGGQGLEAVGSASGIRSRAVKRSRIAKATPKRNTRLRRPAKTNIATKLQRSKTAQIMKGSTQSQLESKVQKLTLQVNSLRTTIQTLQNRLAKLESVMQVNNSGNVTINSSAKIKLNGSTVEVSSGQVIVNAGMSKFNGVVQSDTLITNSVVSSSYTPGAGNIW